MGCGSMFAVEVNKQSPQARFRPVWTSYPRLSPIILVLLLLALLVILGGTAAAPFIYPIF